MSASVMLIHGRDLFVEELFDALIAPNAGFEFLKGDAPRLNLLLEFFFRIGGLEFAQTSLDISVRRDQRGFLGALKHDFVVDQRTQNLQPAKLHLVLALAFRLARKLSFVRLVDFVVLDWPAVNGGSDIRGNGPSARAEEGETA